MKELEHHGNEALGKRPLKSLLKKPNQKKSTPKNRVVINEKLNEFFAADYIILIKEECCADYEEECDCCCQETEMIRVGNCKECRAELTRQLTNEIEQKNYDKLNIKNNYDNNIHRIVSEESQCEDEGEDEEYEEEIDDYEDDGESSEEQGDNRCLNNGKNILIGRGGGNDKIIGGIKKICNNDSPIDNHHHHHHDEDDDDKNRQQQTETLSPPEGYKDVCEDDDNDNDNGQVEIVNNLLRDDVCSGPVCGECNYYHQQKQQQQHQQKQQQQQQRNSDAEDQSHGQVALEAEGDEKSSQERLDDASQQPGDQVQQTTSDNHQRYLVETITMTTVTERRIVREISEEEQNSQSSIDQPDAPNKILLSSSSSSGEVPKQSEDHLAPLKTDELSSSPSSSSSPPSKQNSIEQNKDTTTTIEQNELLSYKIGNSTLVKNSLKPNSAVRQLFPDPRFISPPPAVSTKSLSLSNDETTTDSDSSDQQKFLITTESLRLFDTVKRTNISNCRSDSSESDTSTIKRKIERNALRRSLICKYDKTKKSSNLRGKDLTLEERIRQLTCIDQDDDIGDSASETQSIDQHDENLDFPIRTSPSGEERPQRDNRIIRQNCQDHENTSLSSSPIQHIHPHQHHHHHHHHNHQSTYRKITDLFGQKKYDNKMPDIGLGDTTNLMKDLTKSQITKMSNDARKQFLSSLAPLSCVTTSGIDARDDYYQLTTSKLNNHDAMSYNSDSSYSLEDIDAVLKGDDKINKNSCGPPDVTRGTPTGNGPDSQDATNDELLAFVEQDKTRTERLKRRYDTDDHHSDDCNVIKVYEKNGNKSLTKSIENSDDNVCNNAEKINDNNDDDDDELNDYGFNKRPSVRGITPQFETTNEIIRKIRCRTIPTTINEQLNLSWPYYDQDIDKNIQFIDDKNDKIKIDGRDNTIKRINTMQRQIDDIYQTIAETTVSVQGTTMDRTSFHETTSSSSSSSSTLPRTMPRSNIDIKNSGQQQAQQYLDPRIRIDTTNMPPIYNTLPAKNRRSLQGVPLTNTTIGYPCGVVPIDNNTKCYRTMYFVPYSGISDPTYQNIQRILPAQGLPANYANHIERYPYPINRADEEIQTQPRYYARPSVGNSVNQTVQSQNQQQQPQQQQQSEQHLHMHQAQPDYRFSTPTIGLQAVQLQHHQHISQLATYNVQTMPTYTVMAPSRNFSYSQIQPTRNPNDLQTQTLTINSMNTTNLPGNIVGGFNNGFIGNLGNTSLSSSTNSVLNSPTKISRSNNSACSTERGVPEGAASAPSHDFSGQTGNNFIGHTNNSTPPNNTQNSIYYAMNV